MTTRKTAKTMTNDNKRANGRYYTVANLFDTKPFREWSKLAGLPETTLILAMFSLKDSKDVSVHNGGKLVGKLSDLERHLPRSENNNTRVQFNIPNGRLGLVAIDNTRQASIRFCRGSELEGYPIGQTSRMITRISGNFGRSIGDFVENLNERLEKFREETSDVFLTPFKGLRRDGKYRRRLDYALAREFIRGAQGYEW